MSLAKADVKAALARGDLIGECVARKEWGVVVALCEEQVTFLGYLAETTTDVEELRNLVIAGSKWLEVMITAMRKDGDAL